MLADIGVLGLGVMGKSLARNFSNNGINTLVFNLPLPGQEYVVTDFVHDYGNEYLAGSNSIGDFVQKLSKQRIVLLMVTSGEAVDTVIDLLLPRLEAGDIIIDAGNSFYKDTVRRIAYLAQHNIQFVGMGVSGGEEGALKGPAIMPAGSSEVKHRLLPLLEKIAATADGKPCVTWVGSGGAGHFVKMVHNGIEYADMQILSEAYQIAKQTLNYSNEQIATMMESWQSTILKSYLLEITIDILRHKEDGAYTIDSILDVAGHKGTGQWTITESLQLGVAIPTICAAMNERIISGHKSLREQLSLSDTTEGPTVVLDSKTIQGALVFARLVALSEGLHLIKIASDAKDWHVNIASIAQVWRGGCIIRSEMLLPIIRGFASGGRYEHLFEIPEIHELLQRHLPDIEELLIKLCATKVSTPALSSTLQYYKSMHTRYLPINLVQGQRDYFGAHTYKKIGHGDQIFHSQWKNN